eukprot:5919565-Lingulodinium_polyedra.AAC.1
MGRDLGGSGLWHPDQQVGLRTDDVAHHVGPQVGVVHGLPKDASQRGRGLLVYLVGEAVSAWRAALGFEDQGQYNSPQGLGTRDPR